MTFKPVKDRGKVSRYMEDHKFKLVEGGKAYDIAKGQVLEQVRKVSKRWFKLLRGVGYKDLFVFRFMDDGRMSLDLDVYGTKLEGILKVDSVMRFLLSAKTARWEFREGFLFLTDRGKTDKCEVLEDTESGKVWITDGKDTLESA